MNTTGVNQGFFTARAMESVQRQRAGTAKGQENFREKALHLLVQGKVGSWELNSNLAGDFLEKGS